MHPDGCIAFRPAESSYPPDPEPLRPPMSHPRQDGRVTNHNSRIGPDGGQWDSLGASTSRFAVRVSLRSWPSRASPCRAADRAPPTPSTLGLGELRIANCGLRYPQTTTDRYQSTTRPRGVSMVAARRSSNPGRRSTSTPNASMIGLFESRSGDSIRNARSSQGDCRVLVG